MWFSKKKKEKDKLTSEAILSLNKLKRKKVNQESPEKLNEIIRTFLKEKYNLGQGLTVTELMKELKKKRIDKQKKLDLAAVLVEIHEKEYKSKTPPTRNQLNTLIDQTKKIIKN